MASLTLTPVQLASTLGALQGLLLTGVLAVRRKNRTANRILAALMGAFTVYLASSVYYGAGVIREYPHFFGLSYPTPWLFGPLVYLYALAASDREWRIAPRTWWHLAPVAVVVLVGLPYYLLSAPDKLALVDRMAAGDVPLRLTVIDPTKYVSGLAYTVATARYLHRHRRTVERSYSNTARVNLRWLVALAVAAAMIWLLATALRLGDPLGRLGDDHVSLALALLVYAVGYMGLRQPEVFRYDTMEHPVPGAAAGTAAESRMAPPVAATDAPGPVHAGPLMPEPSNDGQRDARAVVASDEVRAPVGVAAPDESAARYERSGLGDDEAARLREALAQVMERAQPWRDPDLTLADLATLLGSTPHKVSEVLNGQVGATFYDFVNGYRVRDVQRRIAAGEARARKMLALAMDAGFASKSTFNQAFKKQTGQTPSEYREVVGA